MTHRANGTRFVLCVKNRGYEASLEIRKIYRALESGTPTSRKLVRVVDESGEDYLYPESFFVPIDVPTAALRALSKS